jgi:hypothetical protein
MRAERAGGQAACKTQSNLKLIVLAGTFVRNRFSLCSENTPVFVAGSVTGSTNMLRRLRLAHGQNYSARTIGFRLDWV